MCAADKTNDVKMIDFIKTETTITEIEEQAMTCGWCGKTGKLHCFAGGILYITFPYGSENDSAEYAEAICDDCFSKLRKEGKFQLIRHTFMGDIRFPNDAQCEILRNEGFIKEAGELPEKKESDDATLHSG